MYSLGSVKLNEKCSIFYGFVYVNWIRLYFLLFSLVYMSDNKLVIIMWLWWQNLNYKGETHNQNFLC